MTSAAGEHGAGVRAETSEGVSDDRFRTGLANHRVPVLSTATHHTAAEFVFPPHATVNRSDGNDSQVGIGPAWRHPRPAIGGPVGAHRTSP